MSRVADYCRLFRPFVALMSGGASAAGYLAGGGGNILACTAVFAAVASLAGGAAAFNQCQEVSTDRLMNRTKNRPLPAGRISVRSALLLSGAAIMTGLLLLLAEGSSVTVLLGLTALVWYNGIYTNLKRKTAFAAMFGSLSGALIPLIGWSAANADLAAPRIWALALFLIIWQMPHYGLLVLKFGDDYAKAGFPTFLDVWGEKRLIRLVSIWLCTVAVGGLAVGLYGTAETAASGYSLLIISVLLIIQAWRLLASHGRSYKTAFGVLHCYLGVLLFFASLAATEIPGRVYQLAGHLLHGYF
ncbi:MAG TPA: UbiA family prenyltransferase [Dissulfurispiraceae bacterium]|nr:UbiA family prenyltransferase [Dissulfurispiraceae bacterium]